MLCGAADLRIQCFELKKLYAHDDLFIQSLVWHSVLYISKYKILQIFQKLNSDVSAYSSKAEFWSTHYFSLSFAQTLYLSA